MLKYAIILLDRTSTAFCHADNPYTRPELMPLDTLKKALMWAMKQGLMVQCAYPAYELPPEYDQAIGVAMHASIRPCMEADVTVFEGFEQLASIDIADRNIVVRTTLAHLLANRESLADALAKAFYVSVIITDLHTIDEAGLKAYAAFLQALAKDAEQMLLKGITPQTNILTDRLQLKAMNNCNAGFESVTIAPNGKFYACPAFYYDDENDSIGSLDLGLDIKNAHLYRIDSAPICRVCDAWHCHRCPWLSKKATLEVNIPGHEQCVAAHLERNATRSLLLAMRAHGSYLEDIDIPQIDYLDPIGIAIEKKH